jgi:hypothetical protein
MTHFTGVRPLGEFYSATRVGFTQVVIEVSDNFLGEKMLVLDAGFWSFCGLRGYAFFHLGSRFFLSGPFASSSGLLLAAFTTKSAIVGCSFGDWAAHLGTACYS